MFANFDEGASLIVFYAMHEAAARGCAEIRPEHILLAADRQGDADAVAVLASEGLTHEALLARYPVKDAASGSECTALPLSDATQAALALGGDVVTARDLVVAVLSVAGHSAR